MHIYEAILKQDRLIHKLTVMLSNKLSIENLFVNFTSFLLDTDHDINWSDLSHADIEQLCISSSYVEELALQMWDNHIGNIECSEIDNVTDFCSYFNEKFLNENMQSQRSILRHLLYTRIIKLNNQGIIFSAVQLSKIYNCFAIFGINFNISINSSIEFIVSKILESVHISHSHSHLQNSLSNNYFEQQINILSSILPTFKVMNNDKKRKYHFYSNIYSRINDFSKSSMQFSNLILDDIKYNLCLAIKYKQLTTEEFVEIFKNLCQKVESKYKLSSVKSAFYILDFCEKYLNQDDFYNFSLSNIEKNKIFQYLSFFLEDVIEDSDKISQYEFLKISYWLSNSFVVYSDKYNSYETYVLELLNKTTCDTRFITDVIENGWLTYYAEFRNWCLMQEISTTFDGLFIDTEALFIQYQQLPHEDVDRRSVIKYAKLFEYDKANIILENLYNHCFVWTMFSDELKEQFVDAITQNIKLMSFNKISNLLDILLGVFDRLDEKAKEFLHLVEQELTHLRLKEHFAYKILQIKQINYYDRNELFKESKNVLYASNIELKNINMQNKIIITADYQPEEVNSPVISDVNMLNKPDYEQISSLSTSGNDLYDGNKDDKIESENLKRESLEEREPIIVTDYSQEEEKSSESEHLMLNKFDNQQISLSSASRNDVYDRNKDDKIESENLKRESLEEREPIIVTDYSQEEEKSSESEHLMLNKFDNQQISLSSASRNDVYDRNKDDKIEAENLKRESLEEREPIIVTDYSQEEEKSSELSENLMLNKFDNQQIFSSSLSLPSAQNNIEETKIDSSDEKTVSVAITNISDINANGKKVYIHKKMNVEQIKSLLDGYTEIKLVPANELINIFESIVFLSPEEFAKVYCSTPRITALIACLDKDKSIESLINKIKNKLQSEKVAKNMQVILAELLTDCIESGKYYLDRIIPFSNYCYNNIHILIWFLKFHSNYDVKVLKFLYNNITFETFNKIDSKTLSFICRALYMDLFLRANLYHENDFLSFRRTNLFKHVTQEPDRLKSNNDLVYLLAINSDPDKYLQLFYNEFAKSNDQKLLVKEFVSQVFVMYNQQYKNILNDLFVKLKEEFEIELDFNILELQEDIENVIIDLFHIYPFVIFNFIKKALPQQLKLVITRKTLHYDDFSHLAKRSMLNMIISNLDVKSVRDFVNDPENIKLFDKAVMNMVNNFAYFDNLGNYVALPEVFPSKGASIKHFLDNLCSLPDEIFCKISPEIITMNIKYEKVQISLLVLMAEFGYTKKLDKHTDLIEYLKNNINNLTIMGGKSILIPFIQNEDSMKFIIKHGIFEKLDSKIINHVYTCGFNLALYDNTIQNFSDNYCIAHQLLTGDIISVKIFKDNPVILEKIGKSILTKKIACNGCGNNKPHSHSFREYVKPERQDLLKMLENMTGKNKAKLKLR